MVLKIRRMETQTILQAVRRYVFLEHRANRRQVEAAAREMRMRQRDLHRQGAERRRYR